MEYLILIFLIFIMVGVWAVTQCESSTSGEKEMIKQQNNLLGALL